MRTVISTLLTAAAAAILLSTAPVIAQICDDAVQCTNPDMCSNGTCTGTPISGGSCDDGNVCTGSDTCANGNCQGTPLSGGSCDDGNPCTTEDTCVSGVCQGTPASNDTPCGTGGCGQCFNGACAPAPGKMGQPCTFPFPNPCVESSVCFFTVCLPQQMTTCPNSDDDLCTLEFCNPINGACQSVPVTCDQCSQCEAGSGSCIAANEGNTCDDFNECTGDGTCLQGACVSGASGNPTPTSTPLGVPTGTAETVTATATETEGVAATPTDTASIPATPTDTVAPTEAATATATATGVPTGTSTATATATATETGVPIGTTATVTATRTITNTPAATATATPTTVPPSTFTATATRTATITVTPLPVEATIMVGSASGAPGMTVAISVSLQTSTDVAGTQNDIQFRPQARIPADGEGVPRCTVNPTINKDLDVVFQPIGCTPGTDCTSVRAVVISLDDRNPIPSGSVLYSCDIEIAEDATTSYPLTCTNPGAGDADGNKVGVACTNGTITVASTTPTATATGTSATTVTATATQIPTNTGTATSTPTGNSATSTRTGTATGSPVVTATSTATGAPTNTGVATSTSTTIVTPGTPTSTGTVTRTPPVTATRTNTQPGGTPTNTRRPSNDDDGCQVAAAATAGSAWLLAIPALLIALRRRR